MDIIDNDLLSMQEARILVENAREAQKIVKNFSQEQLDFIVNNIFKEIKDHIEEFAKLDYEETEIGNVEDKKLKLELFLNNLEKALKNMRCVGVIENNKEDKTLDVGVPVGVIAAFCSEANIVSTLIYKSIIAIKSGNGIVFGMSKKAKKTTKKVMDTIINIIEKSGAPQGIISYISRCSLNGSKELLNHKDINLILNTGIDKLLDEIKTSGKSYIYGGNGDSPVFIERTADIKEAVKNIVDSKTFDNGIIPGSEEIIVVEKVILEEVKKEFIKNNAYFLNEEESKRLKEIIFDKFGKFNKNYIGKSSQFLAEKAGIKVEKNVKLLITNEKYLTLDSEYSKEKLCPVLDLYVEEDWKNACEKCIELLLSDKQGHTLIIHSQDENIIEQFILKKPVGRVLVNTGGSYGSLGITTNLFPAMTLGSGVIGKGITSCNVSPRNLIYIRKVGYGVRKVEEILKNKNLEEKLKEIIKTILK